MAKWGTHEYYVALGRLGGTAEKTRPTGFQVMSKKKVSAAGRKGGKRSKRIWTEAQRQEQSELMKRIRRPSKAL